MEKNTVIFVTDKRQLGISNFLPGKTTKLNWTDEADENLCLERIQKANIVVLPTPAKKVEVSKDLTELLKYNLTNCEILFGGLLEEKWYHIGESYGFECYDFMKDELVALENARITAQATIAEIMKYSQYEICGQKIVVTGYGRCGKKLANMLSSMGAKVTVLARSAKSRKQAKADGHNAVDFSYGAEEAYGTHIFVNTVPALVMQEKIFREMHSDAVVIDIASAPGGCDLKAAKEYGIPVIPALSLPAKYVTKSGAGIFANAIYKKAFLDFDLKEDKSWISQIII